MSELVCIMIFVFIDVFSVCAYEVAGIMNRHEGVLSPSRLLEDLGS